MATIIFSDSPFATLLTWVGLPFLMIHNVFATQRDDSRSHVRGSLCYGFVINSFFVFDGLDFGCGT
ncbi:MAG: hypothetical protein WAT22_05275, partial [Saprospiraceae bacterium]